MKHEDDLSDNEKETYHDDKSPISETTGSWLRTEQSEKKNMGRSFTRDPYLGHAAGDYEPLEEDSPFHPSFNVERQTEDQEKKISLMQRQDPSAQQPDDQTKEQEHLILMEKENSAKKIEEIRSSFGAINHNRP